jgi:hypothetical protein
MRARQKFTAVGALALATTAVGGGAVVTSHAMADTPTPEKGTMTVISMMDGSDAIKCVYDEVDLPVPQGHGVFGTQVGDDQVGIVATGSSRALDVIAGTGPSDVNRDQISGGVVIASTTMTPPDGQVPGVPPNFTVASAGNGRTAVADGNETALPPLPFDGIVLDVEDARPGTDEECAALEPTTGVPPVLVTP